ncbi:heme NO-binding domain-containing protein [Natronoarchaeum rubrum]|uniref:heme NO-binding domain-containing protein n=1 Tax=Natronoarchaeum rubrum TaxID=755311 RepID=UPI0021117964|nr:heme NO-binding domain-containing protein [Natronoarchaeum rubrum]
MHGIILKTLKDYIVEQYDTETWEDVQGRAGREGEMYVAVTTYDEEVTVELLEATLDVTDTSMKTFMYNWGEWIIEPLVDIYGSAYVEPHWDGFDLLSQIEAIHTQLRQRRMGEMTPPVLQIEEIQEGTLKIVYGSQRQWCQWIPGLIEGVGDYYDEEYRYNEHSCMLDGDDRCTFSVQRVSNSGPTGQTGD